MPDRSEKVLRLYDEADEYERWVIMLRDADSRVDNPLTMRQFDEMNYSLSSQNIKYRAGSWTSAKGVAGVAPTPDGYTRRQRIINERYFEEINEDTAYWIGFLIGDGSVYEHSATQNLCLSLVLKEEDVEHIELFLESVESDYSITNSGSGVGVTITNHHFVEPLLSLGCGPNKTERGELPELGTNNRHMIRGYSDADGTLRNSSVGGFRWAITAKNRDRLESVKSLVPFSGGNIRENTVKNAYSLNYERVEYAPKVVDYLYPNGSNTEPALQRKIDDVSRWL